LEIVASLEYYWIYRGYVCVHNNGVSDDEMLTLLKNLKYTEEGVEELVDLLKEKDKTYLEKLKKSKGL
jgi:hypothetical protein